LLRRILEAVPLIFAVIIVNFVIIHLTPGDPAIALAGEFGASPEYLAAVRTEMGLNKPLYEQLLIYLSHILHGDLGYSLIYRQPVWDLISSRVPLTVLLVGTALIFASVAGLGVGVFSGKRPYSILDNIAMALSMIGYSIPVFWLGQMLLLSLSLGLGLFPVAGWISLTGGAPNPFRDVLDISWHLTLPALALGVQYLVLIARITRAGLLEQLREDYVLTALAKGMDDNTVVYRHALRNAILPVVTVIGVQFGFVIGGAVVTETVFSWPGIGRLTFDAAFARDYPVLLGILLFISITTVVANLITDILYAVLDPRVRYR
jgi:peptide/nickel transport system permease protein